MITKYRNICAICGVPSSEIHHLVYGRGLRELADSDGLTAPLCGECHRAIHSNGTAGALSKMLGQMYFERCMAELGCEDSREVFMKRYGRSYL